MDRVERIKLLKTQLQELDDNVKKSGSAWIKSVEYYEKLKSSTNDATKPDEFNETVRSYRQIMANQMEVFRSHSQMIRKMSPKAGDFLDKKIRAIERNYLKFLIMSRMKPLFF